MKGFGWLRTGRWAPYDAVRGALGLLLLVAAALKAYQLAIEATLPGVSGSLSLAAELAALMDARWFLVGVVEFEVFFGLWLLADLYPGQTRAAAMACFALFAAVSLFKAISGAASCGCFGRLPVNPWHTAALDIGVVLALVLCRPVKPEAGGPVARPARARISALAVACVVPVLLNGLLVAGLRNKRDAEVGDVYANDTVVVARPAYWTGKPFPLRRYIGISHDLARNDWIVLLYHRDCPQCQEAIAKCAELGVGTTGSHYPQLALIEVPPYAPSSTPAVLPPPSWVLGRLNDSKRWYVETPTIILLHDGEVEGVFSEPEDAIREHRERCHGCG